MNVFIRDERTSSSPQYMSDGQRIICTPRMGRIKGVKFDKNSLIKIQLPVVIELISRGQKATMGEN